MAAKISPPSAVEVKKEIPNDEIKDFAETAMNELLGWYGYENSSGDRAKVINLRQVRSQSSTPEHDSAREDSRSPMTASEKEVMDCGWCRRPMAHHSPGSLGTPEGPRYCSESCFSQSRRASFKRAKTCDWCRHVRHAVSYVDFQDGASQLQFCSDKCLNQYKMQIFCKETQAHLDMNPHLKDKGAGGSGNLITPDLWLRNCRSRSASPASKRSRSGSPISVGTPSLSNVVPAPRPVITLAPPSKLLSNPIGMPSSVRTSMKGLKKRRSARVQSMNSSNNNLQIIDSNSAPSQKPCTLTTGAQDLRLHQMSPIVHHAVPPEQTRTVLPPQPPSVLQHHPFLPPPPNLYPLRSPHLPPPFPHLAHLPTDDRPLPFGPPPPPVTILVPYPIVLPLPIPIPIPIPLSHFAKLSQPAESSAGASSTADKEQRSPEARDVDSDECPDQPLDFTTARTEVKDPEPEAELPEEQKLPRLKITRLQTKRNVARELENNRPLRKRKQVIDASNH
ncbi:sine oculis-binding protein homolog [Phlebotomus argentipes]|uniref:sine oculis-binding protein homolog n=1 Tax=Phlebotomus argentipes TaxID=94469 RepID=UPI00289329F1|nr:sine oculis-binding protein homolog [Phlebotomus argentipes]XP_059607746.1 sine oculis-binding protein homolog [Phlebotomus argentipes]XP_059607747.1 sine oculis-binding protein homolog [Phlebotomus argentipes]